jgi:hypothetical protein
MEDGVDLVHRLKLGWTQNCVKGIQGSIVSLRTCWDPSRCSQYCLHPYPGTQAIGLMKRKVPDRNSTVRYEPGQE